MRDARRLMTEARALRLEELLRDPCAPRRRGRVGIDCMRLGWSEWVKKPVPGGDLGFYFEGERVTLAGQAALDEYRGAHMNAAAELLEPARATRIAPAGAGEPLYMLRYRIYMPHGGTCEFAGAVNATFPQILALRWRQIDRMLRHGLPPLDCWIVPAPADSEASPL